MLGNHLAKIAGVVGFVLAVVGIKFAVRETVHQVVEEATTQQNPIPVSTAPIKTNVFQPVTINFGPTAKKTDPVPVAPTPKAASLVRHWTAPSPGSFKPGDLLNPGRIDNLAFHRDGDKLLTASEAGVDVWDVATGKKLRSFPAAKVDPILARDGRYAAVRTKDAVTIYDTATGRATGLYTLDTKPVLAQSWANGGGAFSPSGEFLLVAVSQVNNNHVLAIESATGIAKRLKLPSPKFELNQSFEQLEPVPGGVRLLLNGYIVKNKSLNFRITEFNPQTQKQIDLTALPYKPWTLDPNRGMRTSNDGLYLAAHTADAVTVIDRIADKPLLALKQTKVNFAQPTFTPDGTRVAFLRHPNFYRVTLGGPNVYPSDTVELHDVKTGKKLAALDVEAAGFPKGHLTSFEFSPDGRQLAIAAGTRIGIFDFEPSFGLPPLPSKPLPSKAEGYPVE